MTALPEPAMRGPIDLHQLAIGLSRHRRTEPRKSLLPTIRKVWIRRADGTRLVQLRHLFTGQGPIDGSEVLAKLFLVARANDDRGDSRALQEPVQRDLCNSLSGIRRHLVQGIDNAKEMLVLHRWPEAGRFVQTAAFWQRCSAPDLAGEPAPAERRPDHRTETLIRIQRH